MQRSIGSEAFVQMCSIKNMFLKIRKIQRKTLAPESLFNKTLRQVFSCEICEIFKSTFFKKHFW